MTWCYRLDLAHGPEKEHSYSLTLSLFRFYITLPYIVPVSSPHCILLSSPQPAF